MANKPTPQLPQFVNNSHWVQIAHIQEQQDICGIRHAFDHAEIQSCAVDGL
jgi:hypothetical protein